MSARQHLLSLYEEWRALTEAEAQAIREGDWDRVDDFQNAKRDLQPVIVRGTDDASQELRGDEQVKSDWDLQLRRIVNTLILLEQRNGSMIAERKQACRSEIDLAEDGHRKLSRVQKSYGNRQEALWQSYS